jgi:hypothetical protein
MWDKQINNPRRYKVLDDFAGAAVLDRETGLVWEQSPETNTRAWSEAQGFCNLKTVGNRQGWRLPTLQELASLLDPTTATAESSTGTTRPTPKLPAGHPFSNVQASDYWSATSGASAGGAWIVRFAVGNVTIDGKAATHHCWCVRGGQGVDPQ